MTADTVDCEFVARVSYAPRELPELRANLADALPAYARSGPPYAQVVLEHVDAIRNAEMFFMATEFGELVQQAADSMPDHDVTRFDAPASSGIVFKSSAGVLRPRADWVPTRGDDDLGDLVSESAYMWVCTDQGILAGHLFSRALFNEVGGKPPGSGSWLPKLIPMAEVLPYGRRSRMDADRKFCERSLIKLFAFWNLIRQTAVTVVEDQVPPRPERRRLLRSGFKTPPLVRVVHLRGSRSSRGDGSAGPKDWRHRWLVRGHWRQQWYPSLESHRPVWIAPHIKGPDDAPLLGGHKVYLADHATISTGEVAS